MRIENLNDINIKVSKRVIDSIEPLIQFIEKKKVSRQEFSYAVKDGWKMYNDFKIKEIKKGGKIKYRTVSSPEPLLKKVQKAVYPYLQSRINFPDYIQAYAPGRSPVDMAKNLHGCEIIAHSDIKNFFGSINEDDVKTALSTVFGISKNGTLAFNLARLSTRKKVISMKKLKVSEVKSLEVLFDNVLVLKGSNKELTPESDINKDSLLTAYEFEKDSTEVPQGSCLSALYANLVGQVFIDKNIIRVLNEIQNDDIEYCKYFRFSDDIYIGFKLKDGSKDNVKSMEPVINNILKECLLSITDTNYRLAAEKTYSMLNI